MKFYSFCGRKGNYIYEKGYEDSKPFKRKIKFKPYLFVDSQKPTKYQTIHGKYVDKITFDDMSEARNFVQKYKDVDNFNIYGLEDYEFLYIYHNYSKGFEFNYSYLNVINIDIETDSSQGFPDITTANREINAITIAKKGKTVTFGFFDYTSEENKKYFKCADEKDLLLKFITVWRSTEWFPDIVTGWNVEFFDIPYIINRIRVVLGEEWVDKLSPFGIVTSREIQQKTGKTIQSYTIFGMSVIDYYAVYKKFAMNERESYKLDYIAEYELKEKKIDYVKEGYKNLDDLYKRNPQLYYTYNIKDAVLIERLENKLHYIEQIVNIAYIERVNFENTLKTVKPWDIIVHNYLMDQNIVIPKFDKQETSYIIEGGYVKEPKPGYYKYVVSVDFTSLYPSIAMQYNISPDTYIKQTAFDKANVQHQINRILNGDLNKLTDALVEKNYTMTANGCLFKRDHRGFIPSLMKEFFDERKRVRKLESVAEKRYESSKLDNDRNEFLKHKNLQTAFKLINNSGYGAIANPYFRWFANYLGEAITLSGQMTTQWVERRVNQRLNEKFGTTDEVYVIYADTDSCYITLEKLVTGMQRDDAIRFIEKYSLEELCPFIDSVCEELAKKLNAFEFKTSMKLEKICDQVFFIAKKRYALNTCYSEGIYYDKPKLKVTGLETVRSSVPKKCRTALEDCFKIIFEGDREKLIKFIDEFRRNFYSFPFEEIGTPSSVKGIEKYYDVKSLVKPHCPMHVRGSIVFNEFLKKNNLTDKYQIIEDYDKIKHCYLKLPNPTFNNVISIKDDVPEELDISAFLDYDRQYEKTFLNPLQVVCDAVGWDTKEMNTLDDMFD